MDLAVELSILFQVLVIDLSLAADNAVVIGMAAGGLPAEQRRRAVWIGLGVATALRVLLAIFATRLLAVTGLTVAGGLLLLWVAWKMYGGMRAPKPDAEEPPHVKTLKAAIWQIVIADLGMSLDNILAVAGAARGHVSMLAVGLVFSVLLTGLASAATAKAIHRWPWLGWIGVATVLYVALRMIFDGIAQIV